MSTVIVGTGSALPPAIVTNHDLAELMDTSDEWIRSRTGVGERRLAEPGVSTADLAAEAGDAALADAGLLPHDIDALVVATMTPDFYAPGSAPLVQDRLGLDTVRSYGIRQQCSGFVYGIDLADSLIASGKADTVLVIGAEVHAGIQPWANQWRHLRNGGTITPAQRERNNKHRHWSVLFGDGAGAAVFRRAHHDGILAVELFTDGSYFDLIQVPALGSSTQPFVDVETIAADAHMPQMNGPMLYRQAVRKMPEAVHAALDSAGLDIGDVDVVVAHQANARIVEGVRKQLGLDAEQVPMNLDRFGNTTAGTLPILFDELRRDGRVAPGTVTVFVAFGAGAHWGAAVYREPVA